MRRLDPRRVPLKPIRPDGQALQRGGFLEVAYPGKISFVVVLAEKIVEAQLLWLTVMVTLTLRLMLLVLLVFFVLLALVLVMLLLRVPIGKQTRQRLRRLCMLLWGFLLKIVEEAVGEPKLLLAGEGETRESAAEVVRLGA